MVFIAHPIALLFTFTFTFFPPSDIPDPVTVGHGEPRAAVGPEAGGEVRAAHD